MKIFSRLYDLIILPYWVLIEIIYGLRLGILVALFLAVVFGSFSYSYKVVFDILLTVVLGGMLSLFGCSYYYIKTKSIMLDNEINILESEVELMPDIKSFGVKDDYIDQDEKNLEKTDFSFLLSLLRSLAFLFGSIPIFSPYLFNVSKMLLIKIIIVYSFLFLIIIGVVEGKVRGQSCTKNILKEIVFGVFLVVCAFLWSSYLISEIKF